MDVPRQTKARKKTGAGKRYPLNMRTTKEMRDRLEQAAAVAGRSLAQEVEFRLERSFFEYDVMFGGLELTYGPRLAGVLLMLGEGIKRSCQASNILIETSSTQVSAVTKFLAFPGSWINMPFVFDQAVQCANALLEALRPPGLVELPASIVPEGSDLKDLGKIVASLVANEVLSDVETTEMDKRAQTIQKLLGPVGSRLRQRLLERENDQDSRPT
jgi:hypothetical protein